MTIPATFLDVDAYRERLKAGETPDVLLRKYYVPDEVKAVPDSRRISFTISTGAVDRQNDTIAVDGWDVENYLKNPVVLFAHRYDQLPVARAVSLSRTTDALKAVAEFPAKGLYPLADTVYEMLKGGFLNATSVGFRPKKSARNEERPGYALDFMAQELLEFSVVPVPCNPEALMDSAKGLHGAMAAGIDLGPLEQAFHFAKAIAVSEIPGDLKAGRKFSKANAKLIRDAHQCVSGGVGHLKSLIDQLEDAVDEAEDEEDKPEPEKEAAPAVKTQEPEPEFVTIADMVRAFEGTLTKIVNAGHAGKE